jgi:o-succinylbenzoate synthase
MIAVDAPTEPIAPSMQVARWSRPLSRAVVVGDAPPQARREGLLVALFLHGRTGVGDAAPLPGLSSESLDDVVAALRALKDDRSKSLESLLARAASRSLPPSLAWAIESAHRDATMAMTTTTEPAAWLQTSQLLGDDARHDEEVQGTVKLKVGRAPLDVECARLARLARAGCRLRLDGNRRLDAPATCALVEAAGEALEFFEEPTPRSALPTDGVPLALDETLDETFASLTDDAPSSVIDAALRALPPARAWVLKPTVLGPARMAHLLASSSKAGAQIVLSSAYDSAVGRRSLIHFGASQGLTSSVHGVGTADVFASDLESVTGPIVVRDGDVVRIGACVSSSSFPDLVWETIW